MRPDRLGFMPAQIRVFIHRIRYKREREYIICYSTNETETVREAKRMSETGNHLNPPLAHMACPFVLFSWQRRAGRFTAVSLFRREIERARSWDLRARRTRTARVIASTERLEGNALSSAIALSNVQEIMTQTGEIFIRESHQSACYLCSDFKGYSQENLGDHLANRNNPERCQIWSVRSGLNCQLALNLSLAPNPFLPRICNGTIRICISDNSTTLLYP